MCWSQLLLACSALTGSPACFEANMHRERLPTASSSLVAEQLGGGAVERLDHAVAVDGDDPVGDVVEHRAGPRLAVAELVAEQRDVAQRLLELARLEEQVDEDRDLGAQDVGHDRREDEVDGAARVGDRDLRLVARVGGDEDDRRVLALAAHADQPRRLVAVHPRHLDVHQDHRERLRFITARSASSPDVGLDHRVAERLQDRS